MSPNFSVPHPLKMQALPKASQELYPVILLPVSSEKGHLYFLSHQTLTADRRQSLTTGPRCSTCADLFQVLLTRERPFPPFPPHPGSYPDGF